MSAEQQHNPEEQSGASSTDYAKLYEEAHPELVKDPAKAEAMAYASKEAEEDARDNDELANQLHTAVSDVNELVPEADKDHEMRETHYTSQMLAGEVGGEAARLSALAEQQSNEAGVQYDDAKALQEMEQHNPDLNRVSDQGAAWEMAHASKNDYDTTVGWEKLAKQSEAEGHPSGAEFFRKNIPEQRAKGDEKAEQAREEHYKMAGGQVHDPELARDMADAGKAKYDEAAANRADAAKEAAGTGEWRDKMVAAEVAERDANEEAEHVQLLAEEKQKSE